jgi:hypothetical protein
MRVPAWFALAIIVLGFGAMLLDGCKALLK